MDRIIPADDYPSGWDAGVGDYFVRLLTREPHFVARYQNGLDALEAEAQAVTGGSFADMTAEAQDALLERAEPEFFALLVEQTMEGFYADPGNGGNKNGIAWDMIGYKVTA